MKLVSAILLVLSTVPRFECQSTSVSIIENESSTIGSDSSDISNIESDDTTTSITEIESSTTEIDHSGIGTTHIIEPISFRGLYGGSYYNYDAPNPENLHYIHGTYQSATANYYKNLRYLSTEDTNSSLDYYLSYGISKIVDDNFEYKDFHHFNHDINRTINGTIEIIPSDIVIACRLDASIVCPENTETICLSNGTIYCMSKISISEPCFFDESVDCVNSTIPCVEFCAETDHDFEHISLVCLTRVIIFDVYEDNKGKTLSRVGGTFIIVDAIKEEDRTFCVTVIVDPKPKENRD